MDSANIKVRPSPTLSTDSGSSPSLTSSPSTTEPGSSGPSTVKILKVNGDALKHQLSACLTPITAATPSSTSSKIVKPNTSWSLNWIGGHRHFVPHFKGDTSKEIALNISLINKLVLFRDNLFDFHPSDLYRYSRLAIHYHTPIDPEVLPAFASILNITTLTRSQQIAIGDASKLVGDHWDDVAAQFGTATLRKQVTRSKLHDMRNVVVNNLNANFKHFTVDKIAAQYGFAVPACESMPLLARGLVLHRTLGTAEA
ncbi:Hypothetical protein D9617_24g016290 [Elsinoe fawcettii]|nr:Hypothetical protein D9617_24g016290 [Elsinoe fawcettii]